MISVLMGSLVLSVLHALIPNHWLPVLAISKQENWTLSRTTYVTLVSGLSHAISTIAIGVIIAFAGVKLGQHIDAFTKIIAPIILISLGVFYVYQHHRHKHFHLHAEPQKASGDRKIILSLVIAMFFSPCMEIEAYYLLAGSHGWKQVMILSLLYSTVTVLGMVLWVRLTYKGLLKTNWHSLEHNAGVITGATLVATGILSFFIH